MPRSPAVEEGCVIIASRLAVNGSHQEVRRVALQLDGFTAEAIDEEAARLGIAVDELVSFSALYYLADADSGRIARQIATSPYPDGDDDSRPGSSMSAGDLHTRFP
jgi:hypothetical protein